jgi:hypothetical protein
MFGPTHSEIQNGAKNLRLHQALKELNDLTHVNLDEYTEEEYEYRGELLAALYAEFQQAGYKTVYDSNARSWKLEKVEPEPPRISPHFQGMMDSLLPTVEPEPRVNDRRSYGLIEPVQRPEDTTWYEC